MTDFVTVRPLRTFDSGAGLKTKRSPEYTEEASRARQLEARGLVEIVKSTAKAESVAEDTADVPKVAEKQTPTKRKRKGKNNADSED